MKTRVLSAPGRSFARRRVALIAFALMTALAPVSAQEPTDKVHVNLSLKGIAQSNAGWTDDVVADSARIHISPTTKVLFTLSGSDQDRQKGPTPFKTQQSTNADEVAANRAMVKPYLLTALIAHASDATTTAMSLHAGGREAFPLLSQSVPINLAQQASITAAEQWALRSLAGDHPKVAKVLAIVSIGLHVTATAQNLRAYHEMRP